MPERHEDERARLLEQAVERGVRAALADPTRKEFVMDAVREVLQDQDPATRKQALKEAFMEIMHEQLARFGAWTLGAIGAAVVIAALGLLLYFGAIKAGWTPPKP